MLCVALGGWWSPALGEGSSLPWLVVGVGEPGGTMPRRQPSTIGDEMQGEDSTHTPAGVLERHQVGDDERLCAA